MNRIIAQLPIDWGAIATTWGLPGLLLLLGVWVFVKYMWPAYEKRVTKTEETLERTSTQMINHFVAALKEERTADRAVLNRLVTHMEDSARQSTERHEQVKKGLEAVARKMKDS